VLQPAGDVPYATAQGREVTPVTFPGTAQPQLDLGFPSNHCMPPQSNVSFTTRQLSECRAMHLQRLRCTVSRPWIRGKTITSRYIWTLVKSRATSSQPSTRRLPAQSALSYRGDLPNMAPRPDLKKQYMSSGTEPKKEAATPRPSARYVTPFDA
jgi:hypothetical protein